MERKRKIFRVSTLGTAIMLAYGCPAFAEDDELAQYINPDSSVSIGAGFQNNKRPQLGIFDGRQDNGSSLLIDADILRRDDATGTWNELRLINLGLDNREVFLGHSRQGDYGATFEYSRISRETPYKVYSGLVGAGTETQTIVLVSPGAGREVGLGMHRDRYTLGLNKFLGGEFEVSVRYRHEEREGKRHFSAYTGAVNQFLVEPINHTTRQIEAMLNYVGKDLQLQGGYYGSWFDNANQLIATNGPTYISLAPDNKAHQLFLNGAYTFTPSTTGTMRLARTVATQDDDGVIDSLRAINSALVWSGFNGVKAKVVTTDVQLGFASSPIKNLSLVGSVNYNDRDDRTPVIPYNSQATPDRTTPHSFTNLNAKFEASYRVLRDLRLLGGVYLENRERSIPFNEINTAPAAPTNAGANWTVTSGVANGGRRTPYRSKTDEVTYKGQVTKNITDELGASLALSHSKRTGSRFYWGEQANLVTPLHMADRERDKLGLKMDWSPAESISLQAQYAQTRDDYGTNGLYGDRVSNGFTLFGTGIKDGGAQLFSLDASFALSKNWALTAWYSRDDAQANQYVWQNNFGTDPIRKVKLTDLGESIGLGIKGKATAKLTVGADLQWNRTDSKYRQQNSNDQTNMTETLPTITNRALRLTLNGTYELDKNSSIRLDAIHDRLSTNDWTWLMWNNAQTGLVPLVYNADGTTVVTKNRQSANFLAVRYVYKFQ